MTKMAAFIPVRGNSDRIPFKNIRLINGRPLMYWVLDAAVASKRVSKVFVSTDSPEIKKVVLDYGSDKVEVVGRSSESSTHTASTESAMLEFADKYEFNNIILIQATSPLIEFRDLDKAIWTYLNTRVEGICSVSPLKKFLWNRKSTDNHIRPSYDLVNRPLSQDWEGILIENGAFYITSKKLLQKSGMRLSGKKIGAYMCPEQYLFEIDDFNDFTIAETLLKHYKGDSCSK